MKDQYFADFGDYQKFSLLQKLRDEGLHVCVWWMKTENDSGTDGKHISYLEHPQKYRSYHPDIFDFLGSAIAHGIRKLSHYEKSKFARGITFENKNIENTKSRMQAIQNIIANKEIDTIMIDPDNGFVVASSNAKNFHKYISYDEVLEIYRSGKNVIVYQHFPRIARTNYIETLLEKLHGIAPWNVLAIQVRHSAYFCMFHKQDYVRLLKLVKEYEKQWGGLAKIFGCNC